MAAAPPRLSILAPHLRSHVLREYGAAAAPSLVVDDALHEHVMRENRAR